MNTVIQNFDFKKIAEGLSPFSQLETDKILLEEAKKKGFDNNNNPYNELFSELFFEGGKLNFKKDLSKEFKFPVVKYLKTFMGSFSPSQEDKAAVSALLLSELVEIT